MSSGDVGATDAVAVPHACAVGTVFLLNLRVERQGKPELAIRHERAHRISVGIVLSRYFAMLL